MRNFAMEFGILLVAIVSVAIALVPHGRIKSRTVVILTAVAAIGLTGFQYYLVAYTGRGLFERAACVVFADGPFCSKTEPPLPEPTAPDPVYKLTPPAKLARQETWGAFLLDKNCELQFGTIPISSFEFWSSEGKTACQTHPQFSATPSGERILVFSRLGNPMLLAQVNTGLLPVS